MLKTQNIFYKQSYNIKYGISYQYTHKNIKYLFKKCSVENAIFTITTFLSYSKQMWYTYSTVWNGKEQNTE